MSSSYYWKDSLLNRRPFSPEIERALTELENSEVFNENNTDDKAIRQKWPSPLQQWAMSPLVESSADNKSMDPLEKLSESLPICKVNAEILRTMKDTDVVLLIAPTGSGKSITAPYLAEQFAQLPETNNFRKTMLVGPTVEHCGSTTRTFESLFDESGIDISAFPNPYDERFCEEFSNGSATLRRARFDSFCSAEVAICTYHTAMRVLPHANLNLLILDEFHEPNDNVQVTMAMALKMMKSQPFLKDRKSRKTSRSLNKLILMTATLDDKERKRYEEYFTSQDLSFKLLDFSDKLTRNKSILMSCLRGITAPPEGFEHTVLSDRISRRINSKNRNNFFKYDETNNLCLNALNVAMGQMGDDLRQRLDRKGQNGDGYDTVEMKSIIEILPGLEQVDTSYSASFKQSNFNFEDGPGFNPLRITSLVKDDMSVTTECTKRGKWGGNLGRIVFTTNLIAAGLTVPNAAVVIDSGVVKILSEYTKDGLRSLETISIDKLMIIQRAGRTGRTTDGEYFLPYSAEVVDEMLKTDHGDLLLNRNFEERHLLYTMLFDLKLLHGPSERLRDLLLSCMKIRGMYNVSYGFSEDVILMNSIFDFLCPEHARFIIQGFRFGIAAHAVWYIANVISRIKFCVTGTAERGKYGGPSEKKSVIDLYCEAMDNLHEHPPPIGFNKKWEMPQGRWELPEKYRGVGDSIALADLLVSFVAEAPKRFNRNNLGIEHLAPCNNFWSGYRGTDRDNSATLRSLYKNLVKEEGSDAVSRYVSQIESVLLACDLKKYEEASALFDFYNTHLVSRDNFCLNDDGRALFSALLTMHSSRVANMNSSSSSDNCASYTIYREQAENEKEFLYPESNYTQQGNRRNQGNLIYGRYSDMFERKGKYSGLIDPITLKQLVYFLNINGDVNICDDSITFELNGSMGKSGIKIKMDQSMCDDVESKRDFLQNSLKKMTYTDDLQDEDFIADLEKFIINLWRECGKTEEDPSERSPTLPPSPPPYPPPSYASLYGNQSNAQPATLQELKDREARGDNGSDMRGQNEIRGRGGRGVIRGDRGSARAAYWGGGRGGRGGQERGGRGGYRGTTRGGEASQSGKEGVTIRLG